MVISPSIANDAATGGAGLALRALTVADAPAATSVIRAAFAAQPRETDPPSSALSETVEAVARKIAAGGGFGVFDDRRPVAVALSQADGDGLMIGRVSVLPQWRGRSLSAQLIDACESRARALGLARTRLRARLALPENERLFQRLGYARAYVEAHPGFDAPTVAALEKPLS